MPSSQARQEARRLIVLADGGALSDLNERLGLEDAPRKDFARIPDAIVKALEDEGIAADCPIDSRIFCTVGSEKAQGFLTKMAQAWTVRPFPLSVAKYERAGEASADKGSINNNIYSASKVVLALRGGHECFSYAGSRHQLQAVAEGVGHVG